MQLKDFLKDIFTDLKNSCLKCCMNSIFNTCQLENPEVVNQMLLQSFGLPLNLNVESYST